MGRARQCKPNRERRDHWRGAANHAGRCEAGAGSAGEAVREAADEAVGVHGATRSRSWSSLAGPIPGIASSSSTDENAPCFAR